MSDHFGAGGPPGQPSPLPPDPSADSGHHHSSHHHPPRAQSQPQPQPQPPRNTPSFVSHVREQSLASASAAAVHDAALDSGAGAPAAGTADASQRWAALSQFYGTLPMGSPPPSASIVTCTASTAPASTTGRADTTARTRDEAGQLQGHTAASHPHPSTPHTPYTPPYTAHEGGAMQGLYAAAPPLLVSPALFVPGESTTALVDQLHCTLADPGTSGSGTGDGGQGYPLSQAQQQQQQHYDSNSQRSLYAASQPTYSHTAPPPPPQQQQDQRRPSITAASLAWSISVPTGPGSPFSPSLRSPISSSTLSTTAAATAAATAASLTPPTMSACFAAPNVMATPPAAVVSSGSSVRPALLPATAAVAATLTWSSSADPQSRIVAPQPPASGRAPSSSAATRPAMQPLVIAHPSAIRDTAAIVEHQQQQQQQRLQPQSHYTATGEGSHAALHCLTSPLGLGSPGTTYYVEETRGSNSGSIGTSRENSRVSMIAISRPSPTTPQQQQQQQAQLPMENQPLYAQLVGQDGSISHFITRSPASMVSRVNSATPLNSSSTVAAAAAALSVAVGSGTAADLSGYSEQNSWARIPVQHQQLAQPFPLNPTRPCPDAQLIAAAAGPPQGTPQPLNAPPSPPPSPSGSQGRGIARRNRDRAVLFVGQLNYEATEADVSQVFACYGKPLSVVVLKDKGKGGRRGGGGGGGATAAQRKVGGSAFVTYASTQEADTAIMALHGRYNAKDDDPDNDDESKYLQVSYGQQTGLISTFGMRHAEKLHASKPENPIPFLAKEQKKKS